MTDRTAEVTRRDVAKGAGLAGLAKAGAVIEALAQPLFTWLFGLATYGLYVVLVAVLFYTPMRELIYGVGCPEGNEQRYIDTLVYHNHCVFEYFNDREEDFLAMDITRGDGWQKLCAFLGKPTPSVPFPHANKAQDRRTNVHKFPILLRARSRLRRFIDEKTPF